MDAAIQGAKLEGQESRRVVVGSWPEILVYAMIDASIVCSSASRRKMVALLEDWVCAC